jgi:hypothetical protein
VELLVGEEQDRESRDRRSERRLGRQNAANAVRLARSQLDDGPERLIEERERLAVTIGSGLEMLHDLVANRAWLLGRRPGGHDLDARLRGFTDTYPL